MTTGLHIVRDIDCKACERTVGWKYDKAYEPGEKYKEGKYILESECLCLVSKGPGEEESNTRVEFERDDEEEDDDDADGR